MSSSRCFAGCKPAEFVVCSSLGLLLLGCGGGAAPSAPPPAAAPQAAAPAPQPAAAAPAPRAQVGAATRSTATKWIGGIPYDVFYDRPLDVVSDQAPLVVAATPGAPAMSPAGTAAAPPPTASAAPPATSAAPPAAASPAGGGGAIDWSQVAAIEQVTDEITSIRNELTQKLSQLSTYNSNWESVGVDATALAALAGVVEVHPGEVSWKANAKVARTLAAAINSNASKTGRSAYDATKSPFDSLVDLLSGNPPGGVQAEEQAPFSDYADRGVLMKRIESTLAGLKSNVNTPDRLKEDPAAVKRKLAMLGTLMSVVATPGYDYIEESEYKSFIHRFVSAAVSGRDAVDANDFNTFSGALGEMQKICGECHQKYAFGE